MSSQFNPYTPPGVPPIQVAPRGRVADLGKRFLGALLDGLAGLVACGPGYLLMIVDMAGKGEDAEPGPLFFAGVGLVLIGGLALFAIHVYLLATRSQSIGKYFMKTQIVDYQTQQPASFVMTFLVRALANSMIGAIPCVGALYTIADILFIFGEEHRCLHDKLANTSVIDIS